jgi:hypothetical protein
MLRSIFLAFVVCSMLVSTGFAQGYLTPGRMNPQEASVIADYWIRSYLRRNATPGEERALANQLMNSSPAHALSSLLASREYYAYAGGTPQGLIRQLIEDVGHRQASPYEIDARLRDTGGLNPQAIALDFLRENPRNWWPGPTATPPRELWYFYRGTGGYGPGYW